MHLKMVRVEPEGEMVSENGQGGTRRKNTP